MTENSMLVGELPVPEELATLIRTGRWGSAHDPEKLQRLVGIEPGAVGVHFLDDRGMSFNLSAMKSLTRRDAAMAESVYGVRSSRLSGGPTMLPLLDVDQGIPILITVDEFQIWLDYRGGGRPIVVCTEWVDAGNPGYRWRMCSSSFSEFARSIGIPPG